MDRRILSKDIVLLAFRYLMAIEPHAFAILLRVSKAYRDTILESPQMWKWIVIDQSRETWREELHLVETLSYDLPLHASIVLPFDVDEAVFSSMPRWRSLEVYVPEGMLPEDAAFPIWQLFKRAKPTLLGGLDWIQNNDNIIMYPLETQNRVLWGLGKVAVRMNSIMRGPNATAKESILNAQKTPELAMLCTGVEIHGVHPPFDEFNPNLLGKMPSLLLKAYSLRLLSLDITSVREIEKRRMKNEAELLELPNLTNLELYMNVTILGATIGSFIEALRLPRLETLGITGGPTVLVAWITAICRHARPHKLSITILADDFVAQANLPRDDEGDWNTFNYVEVIFPYRRQRDRSGIRDPRRTELLKRLLLKCRRLSTLRIDPAHFLEDILNGLKPIMESTHPKLAIDWGLGLRDEHCSYPNMVRNFFASDTFSLAESIHLTVPALSNAPIAWLPGISRLTSLEISPGVEMSAMSDAYRSAVRTGEEMPLLTTLACDATLAVRFIKYRLIGGVTNIRILTETDYSWSGPSILTSQRPLTSLRFGTRPNILIPLIAEADRGYRELLQCILDEMVSALHVGICVFQRLMETFPDARWPYPIEISFYILLSSMAAAFQAPQFYRARTARKTTTFLVDASGTQSSHLVGTFFSISRQSVVG